MLPDVDERFADHVFRQGAVAQDAQGKAIDPHLMPREHGAGMDVLRSLKRALDPSGLLNPGKLGL